jgi:hypothetical protein
MNWRSLSLFFFCFVATACGGEETPTTSTASALVEPEPPGIDVLFVGNSYTFSHRLPSLVEQIAEATEGGSPLRTTMVAHPDYTLEQHWELGEATAAIERGGWEYVVLQGHSLSTLEARERLDRFARKYAPQIRASGATPVFFMTWARRGMPEMMETIAPAYRAIAEELGGLVIPVGEAWLESRRQRPDIHLHHADGSHPSPAGSYLAAAMFYARLGAGPSCVGADHGGFGYLDEEEIRFLQETAVRFTSPSQELPKKSTATPATATKAPRTER